MGFLDFLKKKQNTENKPTSGKSVSTPPDPNALLLDTLKNKLIGRGHQVEKHSQYLSLIVNSELEIDQH